MKILRELILLFLLIFSQNVIFCSSNDLNHSTVSEIKAELILNRTFFENNSKVTSTDHLFYCLDNLETINEFLRPNFEKLFVIIAENMNDGVALAEFLSNKNRVLPETKLGISTAQDLLYNEIMQNYYLYYSNETSVYIFVYPRNVQNEAIAMYLTKKIFESAKKFKVAITCQEEIDSDTFNSMFSVASNILVNVIWDFYTELEGKIIFLSLSVREKSRFITQINNLEEYFYKTFARFGNYSNVYLLYTNVYLNFQDLTAKEKLEVLVIESYIIKTDDMNELPGNIRNTLISGYVLTKSNLMEIKTLLKIDNNLQNLTFLSDKFSSATNGNFRSTDMTTVTDVIELIDWMKFIFQNKEIKIYKCPEEFIIDRGQRIQQLKVIRFICFMKYLSNFTLFYKSIEKEIQWFLTLSDAILIEEDDNEQYTMFSELYEEISTIGGINQDLMSKAFLTINNAMNTRIDTYSCSLLSNETYKLQVKGKFLNFGKIIQKKYCRGEVTFYEFLALDKIVINKNLNAVGKHMQIIIIAPIWEILNDIEINLDGAPGDNSWRPQKMVSLYNFSMISYIDGLPGKPGETGGSFFGIIDKSIERAGNLTISSNGGTGGSGQDGANGYTKHPHQGANEFLQDTSIEKENRILNFFRGAGGKKGQGGLHGIVELFSLNNSLISNIQTSTKNGKAGSPGKKGFYEKCNPVDSCELLVAKRKNASNKSSLEQYMKMRNLLNKSPHLFRKEQIGQDDFIVAVEEYRKYVISSAIETGTISYKDLYMKLNKNSNLVDILNPIVFIKEFIIFEDYPSLKFNSSMSTFMYKAWQNGISQFKTNPKYVDESNEYKKTLIQLNNTISRKIIKEKAHNYYVINIRAFLNQSIKDGEKLRNFEVLKNLGKISNDFVIFEEEIKESVKLIDNELEVYLDDRIEDLNNEIKILVEEIDRMINCNNETIANLENKKSELESKLAFRILFSIFKFIAVGIPFINPTCAAIGSALYEDFFTIVANVLNSNSDSTFKSIKLPESVTESITSAYAKYNENRKKDIAVVENKLNDIKAIKHDLQSLGEDVQPLIDIEESVYENCISKISSNPRQCMIDILESKETKLLENSLQKYNNSEHSLKILSELLNDLDLVKLGAKSYNKITKHVLVIDKVNEKIKIRKNNIIKLENFKKRIFKNLEPQIDWIRMDIHKISDGFAFHSRTLLEYEKFKMNEYLTEVILELKRWTKSFNVSDEVTETMEKLTNAMNVVIQMHTLMKDFRSKIKEAELFTNIVREPFQINYIQDSELFQSLTKLRQIQYAYYIIKDYNELIIAIQGYIYPFSYGFLDFSADLNNLFESNLVTGNIILKEMKNFETHLNKLEAFGQPFQGVEYVLENKFGSDYLPAFYTWNNSMYSSAIANILKGETVSLFANISHQTDFNAIKFRDISIVFTSTDPEIDMNLKNDMQDYVAILYHKGNSYYRCSHKIHLIKSNPSVWKVKFIIHKKRSIPYNDYILSPYATWEIRLMSVEDSGTFDPLAKYINNVNIELVGDGQLMVADKTICNNDLARDYGKEVSVIE